MTSTTLASVFRQRPLSAYLLERRIQIPSLSLSLSLTIFHRSIRRSCFRSPCCVASIPLSVALVRVRHRSISRPSVSISLSLLPGRSLFPSLFHSPHSLSLTLFVRHLFVSFCSFHCSHTPVFPSSKIIFTHSSLPFPEKP